MTGNIFSNSPPVRVGDHSEAARLPQRGRGSYTRGTGPGESTKMTNLIELRVTDRRPFADGHGFGEDGAYERLSGRAHYAVDPLSAAQLDVVDVHRAPGAAQGVVRLEADFMILKPVDIARGNRRVFS